MPGVYSILERLHLMSPATRSLFEQSHSFLDAIHGYIYARYTQPYINFLLKPRPSQSGKDNSTSRWLADHYHAKVLTPDHARSIVVNERVIRKDLEQVVPYPTAREIVLNGPPDIAAYECVCRHARPSPCQPTMVCMVVGQPMVDLVLQHHPTTSRRLTQPEAIQLLEAEHARGHVHTAWFKDAVLGRFYAICNCCSCCCGGMQGHRNGAPFLTSSGYIAEFDSETCTLCGACIEACPFDALQLGVAEIELNWGKCLGCGVCEALCPSHSAALIRDERKGLPLDVRTL